MKKVIATLTLCFMIAGINSEVEALSRISRGVRSIGQKVGDLVKGRKTDDGTRSIDSVVNSIRGLGKNFISSGSTHFKYASTKYLNTNSDLSLLLAYSSFAMNAGDFFSLLESLLAQVRAEYATSLGAQNSANNAQNEQRRMKQENRDELSRNNMQRCLEILLEGNEFATIQANLQSSGIILLTVIKNMGNVPDANRQTMQKHIAALVQKCNWEVNNISASLEQGLSAACEVSEFSEGLEIVPEKTNSLIKNISLIKDILVKLNSYIQNGEKSGIEGILGKTDYYSGSTGSQDSFDDEKTLYYSGSTGSQDSFDDEKTLVQNDEGAEDEGYYSE